MAKAEKRISGQGGRGSQNNPPKADRSSILDHVQAAADAVSALLRAPGGGPVEESHEARVSLNSSGLTPTAAGTAVSTASGVWLRRVLLAVAAFYTLVGSFIDLAVSLPDLNARLFIHPFLAIAALVLAARRYLRAAIVVLATYILAALASGWSLDFALGGLSLSAQQGIFGPLAVTAIVLAILDKLLWLAAVFVALPSANLLLGMIP